MKYCSSKLSSILVLFLAALLFPALGCSPNSANTLTVPTPRTTQNQAVSSGRVQTPVVFISITSDATADPQSVDMGLKMAKFAMDERRYVFIFFSVKGVLFPSQKFDKEFAFKDNDPLTQQLQSLVERGVEVHVCPICMEALGVDKSDLVKGTQVTTRSGLFENIGPNTSVFTY